MLRLPQQVGQIIDIFVLFLFFFTLFKIDPERKNKINLLIGIISSILISFADLHFHMASIPLLAVVYLLFIKLKKDHLIHDLMNLVITFLITLTSSNLGGLATIKLFQVEGITQTKINWILFSTMDLVFVYAIAIILIFLYKKVIQYIKFHHEAYAALAQLSLLYSALTLLIFLLVSLSITRMFAVETNLLSIIIILFSVLAFIIILVCSVVFSRMFKAQEHKHQKERVLDNAQYVQQLEKNYQELRRFKHDNKNLLLSVATIADNNNDKQVSEVVSEYLKINQKDDVRADNDLILQRIKDNLIRGIITTKLLEAEQNGVLASLEVKIEVQELKHHIILTRILGILLDNAIEAAKSSTKRVVYINVAANASDVEIQVSNSIDSGSSIDLKSIFLAGYSTKGPDRGLGLATVKDLIGHLDDVLLNVDFNDLYFNATVLIKQDN